jgi:hypothetical protein
MTIDSAPARSGDFLADVLQMADQLDARLQRSLTPAQYAMVQDLVLATRISTIAGDALEDEDASTVAA